jgi:hypothetical protein
VQDLRDSVAADVAAQRLGRSPHEVRRLVRAGQVCAHRRAGRWFVPMSEVRRLQRLPQPVGRPFSPGSAWALLAMLAGDEPAGLSAPRRSQLRRHLHDGRSMSLRHASGGVRAAGSCTRTPRCWTPSLPIHVWCSRAWRQPNTPAPASLGLTTARSRVMSPRATSLGCTRVWVGRRGDGRQRGPARRG